MTASPKGGFRLNSAADWWGYHPLFRSLDTNHIRGDCNRLESFILAK